MACGWHCGLIAFVVIQAIKEFKEIRFIFICGVTFVNLGKSQ